MHPNKNNNDDGCDNCSSLFLLKGTVLSVVFTLELRCILPIRKIIAI
jgi:hypothetical protein